MQINLSPRPLFAVIVGIGIFVFPKVLNYIVAIYLLIVFGILGLLQM